MLFGGSLGGSHYLVVQPGTASLCFVGYMLGGSRGGIPLGHSHFITYLPG